MARRVVAAIGLIAAGAVLGPLALTLAAALSAKSDDISKGQATVALLHSYRSRLEPFRLLLSIPLPPDGEECGYKRSDLFEEGDDILALPTKAWSPYRGYDALYHWKNDRADEIYLNEVLEYLNRNTSPFSATFLAECMRQTVFASACARYVHDLIEGRTWFGRLPAPPKRSFTAPVEEAALCTYLDGLAARNRRPLSNWPETGPH